MKKRATIASVVATAVPAIAEAKPDHVRGCNTPECDKRIGRLWAKKHPKKHLSDPVVASWYGPGLYGNPLACGGTLTQQTAGVANKKLGCGTKIRLCFKRCVTTRVIDRGPYVGGRTFDLTAPVKNAIGMAGGTASVRYAVVGS